MYYFPIPIITSASIFKLYIYIFLSTWPAHETPRQSIQVFALCTIWTIKFKYHVKLFAWPSTNAYAESLRYLKTWLIMFNNMVNCKAIAFFTFLSSSILYLFVVLRHRGSLIPQMWWALNWNDIDKSLFTNYCNFGQLCFFRTSFNKLPAKKVRCRVASVYSWRSVL